MSTMFGGGFKGAKCKTLLRLAMARIKLLRNKRDIQIKQMRKDIAQLLSSGQEPSARIRVEHIAREQNIMAAYDIIELFCELIIVRLPIIESQKMCPLDLKESVCSLVFASQRCADLPELLQVRSLFASKYGKEFVAAATELRPECGVNRRIIEKLSVRAPSGETKLKLLTEIAAEHNVDWDPANTEAELMKQPEDLLDGPKNFFGPSSTPIIDLQPLPPKQVDTTKRPSAATQASPPVPVAPSEDDEDPLPEEEQQFIPFLRPMVATGVSEEKFNSPPKVKEGSRAPAQGSRSSSKETFHAKARNEGKMEYDKRGDYDDVAAAAAAAAKSADRAVAAARAAAELAKTHPSQRDSLPRRSSQEEEFSTKRDSLSRRGSREEEPSTHRDYISRRGSREESHSQRNSLSRHGSRDEESSSSEDDGEEGRQSVNTKDAPRNKPEPVRQEKGDRVIQQNDPEYRQEKSDPYYTRQVSDGKGEVSFNRSNAENKQDGVSRKSKSEYKEEGVFRRSNNDDVQDEIFRRGSSEDKQEGSFRKSSLVEPENSSRRSYLDNRTEKDDKPPAKFDGEEETFWTGGNDDWKQGSYLKPEKDIDTDRFFNSRGNQRESLYRRDSDLFKSIAREEPFTGRSKDTYSGTPKIFTSSDSGNNLFKRNSSEDVGMRSSAEAPYFDRQQGLPTPKFDEDEQTNSKDSIYTTNLVSRKDLDSPRSNFDIPRVKPSFTESLRSPSMSHSIDDSSDLHSPGSFETGEMAVSSHEDQKEHTSAIPSKSRRTRAASKPRENLDSSGIGGQGPPPGRRPKSFSNETLESSCLPEVSLPRMDSSIPQSFDDSRGYPSSRTGLPSYNSLTRPASTSEHTTPATPSAQFHEFGNSSPPEAEGSESSRSSPGLERKISPSLHPKLSDIDNLAARFEALQGRARR